jgi:hypothetical protein
MSVRFEGDSASGADRHDLNVRQYKQSKSESELEYSRLESLPWSTKWDDPTFETSPTASRGAKARWHSLLKQGRAAKRIVRSAELFLRDCPDNQVPSLAGYMSNYAEDGCTDSTCSWYVPEGDQDQPVPDKQVHPPTAGNDNHAEPARKYGTYGGECDTDAPF